jgi:hypothetical protein
LDWSRLSPLDFEDLVGDLLEADEDVSLERFGPGPDGGIDLRSGPPGPVIVVQCKHYSGTGWAKLAADLRKEKPKVELLRPDRYIVATSVSLSPGNKETIANLFHPWMVGSGDVRGAQDIEKLLRQYPAVELSHPKIWAPSSAVLERILNAGVLTHTEWTIDEAKRDSRIFVRPAAYGDAREMLREHHVCVISGPPGIGKTMLARMLLIEYIQEGFAPIVLRDGIDEAYNLVRENAHQVFYFDDFLGQTDISEISLGKNEDDRMLRFFERIRESSNKRIVLTTREYVLRDALAVFERLRRASEAKVLSKVTLDLTRYARLDRARILYNHLWDAAAHEPKMCAPFAFRSNWKPIIDHHGFNPRVIRGAIEQAKRYSYVPDELPAAITKLLDSPSDVWAIPFSVHLNEAERTILRALLSLPECSLERTLFEDSQSRHLAATRSYLSRDVYRLALETLEGTFIQIVKFQGGKVYVTFANPPVRDFLLTETSGDTFRLDEWLQTAARPEQVAELLGAVAWGMSRNGVGSTAGEWFRGKCAAIADQVEAALISGKNPHSGLFFRRNVAAVISQFVSSMPGDARLIDLVVRLAPCARSSRWATARSGVDLVSKVPVSAEVRLWIEATIEAVDDWDDLEHVVSFADRAPTRFDERLMQEICGRFFEHVTTEVAWARNDSKDRAWAHAALKRVEEIAEMLGLDSPVSDSDREEVESRFDGSASQDEYKEAGQNNVSCDEDVSDQAVDRIFNLFSSDG